MKIENFSQVNDEEQEASNNLLDVSAQLCATQGEANNVEDVANVESPDDVELHFLDQQNHRTSSFQSQLSTRSNILRHQSSFRIGHRPSFLVPSISVIQENLASDYIDSVPEEMSFTYIEALALIFSILSYLVDTITDVTVATFHYLNENYWYFALTVAFVVFPTLIMTSISLRWYILDSREDWPKISKLQWLTRVLFLLFQLGPIMRYIDSLCYGLQFRKHNDMRDRKNARKYYKYMIYEDADATMLRLFECFLEAAPQLVLQIYILAVSSPHSAEDWTVVVQVASVIASLVSLSWSLVSYMRILRMSLSNKKNMTWPGTVVQFLWRLSVIASRVLTLALFASQFTYYIGIVCGIHWMVMFVWIVSMKTNFCNNFCEELLYNAIVAVVFIFCYFNPVDTPTRRRFTFYYAFSFVENVLLLTLWYNACDPNKWYRIPAFVGFFVCFFTGLVFMIIYYLKLHPTQNIGLFRSNDRPASAIPEINCSNISSAVQTPVAEEKCKNKPNNYDKYRRQFSDVWTAQSRLLHPRPAIPII